ncbi:Bromodomain containing protein [Aureococcus anophagefferens]|nr:Bromodomain containing protein [Aureococcus anophagefferens]
MKQQSLFSFFKKKSPPAREPFANKQNNNLPTAPAQPVKPAAPAPPAPAPQPRRQRRAGASAAPSPAAKRQRTAGDGAAASPRRRSVGGGSPAFPRRAAAGRRSQRRRAAARDDLEMMATRHARPALASVPYDFEVVPSAARDLAGSVVVTVPEARSRETFSSDLAEMLTLCGEAAWRGRGRACGPPPAAPHDAKPLMLEYMCDRLDVDDPMWGYEATDGAVPFYEALGFVRVGVLARHAAADAGEAGASKPAASRGERCYAFRKALFGLVKRLSDCDANRVFQEPVDTTLVTDYLDVVAQPMDFGTMRRKVVAGAYGSLAAVERDLALIYGNCLRYNPPGNPWHDACLRFRDRALAALRRWKRERPAEAAFAGPPASPEELAAAADGDDDVMGLCVWSFPDTPVEDQYPCYMMALDLKRPRGAGGGGQRRAAPQKSGSPRCPGASCPGAAASRPCSPRAATATTSASSPARPRPRSPTSARASATRSATGRGRPRAAASAPDRSPELRRLVAERRDVADRGRAAPPRRRRLVDDADDYKRRREDLCFAARRRRPSDATLYEAVVVLVDQPPCYAETTFWFVHQYVPDVDWCRLCPLVADGAFADGNRAGRARYVLPPEATARELDLSAKRCVLVRSAMTVDADDADDEVWDVEDPARGAAAARGRRRVASPGA